MTTPSSLDADACTSLQTPTDPSPVRRRLMKPPSPDTLSPRERVVVTMCAYTPTWALGRCFRTYSLSMIGSDSHSASITLTG